MSAAPRRFLSRVFDATSSSVTVSSAVCSDQRVGSVLCPEGPVSCPTSAARGPTGSHHRNNSMFHRLASIIPRPLVCVTSHTHYLLSGQNSSHVVDLSDNCWLQVLANTANVSLEISSSLIILQLNCDFLWEWSCSDPAELTVQFCSCCAAASFFTCC